MSGSLIEPTKAYLHARRFILLILDVAAFILLANVVLAVFSMLLILVLGGGLTAAISGLSVGFGVWTEGQIFKGVVQLGRTLLNTGIILLVGLFGLGILQNIYKKGFSRFWIFYFLSTTFLTPIMVRQPDFVNDSTIEFITKPYAQTILIALFAMVLSLMFRFIFRKTPYAKWRKGRKGKNQRYNPFNIRIPTIILKHISLGILVLVSIILFISVSEFIAGLTKAKSLFQNIQSPGLKSLTATNRLLSMGKELFILIGIYVIHLYDQRNDEDGRTPILNSLILVGIIQCFLILIFRYGSNIVYEVFNITEMGRVLVTFYVLWSSLLALLIWSFLSRRMIRATRELKSTIQRNAEDMVERNGGAHVLLLRSFMDDDQIVKPTRSILFSGFGAMKQFERLMPTLVEASFSTAPTIGAHNPHNPDLYQGIASERLQDENWKAYITRRMLSAFRIILIVGRTTSLKWEVDEIVRLGLERKVILVIPPFLQDLYAPGPSMVDYTLGKLGFGYWDRISRLLYWSSKHEDRRAILFKNPDAFKYSETLKIALLDCPPIQAQQEDQTAFAAASR